LPPGPRAIGSPGSHPLTRFRAQPWHFLTAVPAANSSRSSSHAAFPLQSSCAPTPAPSSQSGQHLPRVFCPLRDVTGSVLAGEDSAPHCGPPSGFLNLSAVCSAASFAGLFRPAATSRVRSAQPEPAALAPIVSDQGKAQQINVDGPRPWPDCFAVRNARHNKTPPRVPPRQPQVGQAAKPTRRD
jgi:hypothetical protein